MKTGPIFQRHIFLADDDSDDRQMFEDALAEVDNSAVLTQVEDGFELMQLLSLPPEPLPEIIFLDLNMPRKNGLDCLSEIRNHNGQLKDPVVIMFTTSTNPSNIYSAYESGASLYAVKPNSYEGLKKIISTALSLNRDEFRQPVPKKDFVLNQATSLSHP